MEYSSFKDIVKDYQVVFFDAYGVLKNSAGLIPGIEGTFKYLEEHNIDYYILTNDASRGPKSLAQYYINEGLTSVTHDKIISSGMLATEYLRLKVKHGTVAYLGTVESAHYLEQSGLKTLPIHELNLRDVSNVNALVFMDDEGFDWNHDITKIVNLLRNRNIPSIVANTDKSYPVSDKEVGIAIGGIANMVEDITGRKFIKFGKPDAQMFIFAYEHCQKAIEVGRESILMVGDTLFTDIMGGNKFGIDTALVLTGNTLPENASDRIKQFGIIPDYICDSAAIE
ncbi:MAG: HAD-IIA family hydrolase [Bacteroidetes bacterium]|nr:HAD-IIA family hydrolase [Bacteroidota bacterium]MDA1121200.1 HAD-IIA family hydrolase [Bacteroidota bacterium]